MTTGITVLVILAAASVIIAAVVATIASIKLWRAADSADRTIAEAREEWLPLLKESRAALTRADEAVSVFRNRVDRAGRLLVLIEELVGGGAVALVASKAAQTSSIAAKGVVEGLRYGLKALLGARKESKEEQENA